jgi:hypothetical protein
MKRSNSVRVWSVFAKVGLLIFLLAAAFDARSRAVADGTSEPAPPDSEPAEPWDGHIPNTPYPDGPDEILLSAWSAEEQAGIEAIGERSNLGVEVHSAWSVAAHSVATDAAVHRAAHQSGTTGLDSIGIAP